ncbi:hypothetical protein [Jannaschia seohaensis]|uniref:Uncharacterized protein n=1 Tax=Jannaschia seohaensis TaxID=475081 RepID=A0A2Y9AK50_9RHOB|nr:hypothetical protein [Jannaschia seohaensis]PWJ20438.1 hypothetical protein BCF38_103256 [Jannaschia seohaensis]SSA44525.1 hypothetical protein SAMN05421539_103256 [Jannaschia seohaensis]
MYRALFLLPLLAACAAELPSVEGSISEAARAAPAPRLIPTGPVLAARDAPVRAQSAEVELTARAARLRQAVAGAAPLPGPTLEARGADLRRRADALRAAPL